MEEMFGVQTKVLNAFGISLSPLKAQYIEIGLSYSETGIVSHSSEWENIPQIDIIPEVFGYKIEGSHPLSAID